MPGPTFRIAVDLASLIPPLAPVNADVFPNLAHAVQTIAQRAQQKWVSFAMGEAMPNGKMIQNRTGEYARSILVRSLGPFSAEVYSDLAYAHVIEEGGPARDLKRILNSSMKVRLTDDGRRYLIIPFRWNTPGSVMGHSMPQALWDWWQHPTMEFSGMTVEFKARASWVRGTYARPSGTGAIAIRGGWAEAHGHLHARGGVFHVVGWKYNWGTRVTGEDLDRLGIGGQMAKRLGGMVLFRKPGDSGGSSHSRYITFRTMMEGSRGWVTKPQAGKWPARQVAELVRPVAEEIFRKAVEADIAILLPGGEIGMS